MLISIFVFVWLTASLIQLYFWLMIAWPLESHRDRFSDAMEPVSVIVCTNQPNDQLKSLIAAILAQDYDEFELILVNDGPSQEVRQHISEFTGHGTFRYVEFQRKRDHNDGKKAPLEAGIDSARYDWILLTDSDCEVRQGWMAAMMLYASRKSRMVLGYSPMIDKKAAAARIASFDTILIATQYLGWAIRQRTYMGVGRNLLYHRSLFEDAGGFEGHTDLASGDDDLLVQTMARMTHTAVCLDRESIVYTMPKTKFSTLVNQKLRHISTADRYDRRSSQIVWIMAASYIAFWVLLPPVLIFAPGIPLLIAAASVMTMWWVFYRVSARLEAVRFVGAFPVWCLLYALFLIYLGIMKLLGRTPNSWN